MTPDTNTAPSQHDFLAAALVPTNEQRIVAALEDISAQLRARFNPVRPTPVPVNQQATTPASKVSKK